MKCQKLQSQVEYELFVRDDRKPANDIVVRPKGEKKKKKQLPKHVGECFSDMVNVLLFF